MAATLDNGTGTGTGAWPYTTVPVNIVGRAVKNRSTLQWSDNPVDIYAGNLDSGGAPQRAPDCGCAKSATPLASATSTTGPRPAGAASS